jgi:hypothetical protein
MSWTRVISVLVVCALTAGNWFVSLADADELAPLRSDPVFLEKFAKRSAEDFLPKFDGISTIDFAFVFATSGTLSGSDTSLEVSLREIAHGHISARLNELKLNDISVTFDSLPSLREGARCRLLSVRITLFLQDAPTSDGTMPIGALQMVTERIRPVDRGRIEECATKATSLETASIRLGQFSVPTRSASDLVRNMEPVFRRLLDDLVLRLAGDSPKASQEVDRWISEGR